jgi:transcriptional regulator with PAS, ATPase and Fis domain
MFENIIDNFIYPIIVTDNEGIIFINKLTKALYGISNMKDTDKIKKILKDIQLKEILVNEKPYKINTFNLEQYKISIMIPNINNDLQMKVDMYEEIMNNINQGIFVSDTHDNLIFANKSALNIDSINDSISKNIKRDSIYENFLNDLSPCEYVLKTKKALCNYKAEYSLLNGKHVTAMVYLMNEGRSLGQPSCHYYSTILEGYKDSDFNIDILRNAVGDSAEGDDV